MDDSIRLRIFQRTLTGIAAKWYIELPQHSLWDFNALLMAFLMHFQLLIWYETGTDLLTSLHQTTYTHISDHIHEWRRRWRLIKDPIPYQLLADLFTNTLLPPIAKDVTMGGAVTKEQAISHAQYLDLVYSHSGTLYDLISHAPRPTTEPPADGILGSVQTQTVAKSS